MAKSKRVMNCGCIIVLDYGNILHDGTLGIIYCPKHEAAPELYEALKMSKGVMEALGVAPHVMKVVDEALAKSRRSLI